MPHWVPKLSYKHQSLEGLRLLARKAQDTMVVIGKYTGAPVIAETSPRLIREGANDHNLATHNIADTLLSQAAIQLRKHQAVKHQCPSLMSAPISNLLWHLI